LPPPLQVRHGQRARTGHQTSEGANESAVDGAERVDELIEETPEREIAGARRPLAASRAIRSGHRAVTRRARPRLGDRFHRWPASSKAVVTSVGFIVFTRLLLCGPNHSRRGDPGP